MVLAVRRGRSLRDVQREFQVSLSTVQYWVRRAHGQRLDRVDWADAPRGGRRAGFATPPRIEDRILRLRKELKETSDLGEFGAAAIRRALEARGERRIPSLRTIGRILLRRGALDGRQRVRRPPPPKGWYLPAVAAARAELDSFDFVEGLVIERGPDVVVLNALSLQGGLCASWVRSSWTAKFTVETLIAHWAEHGLPHYAQFDNDTLFQGNHRGKDSFGRVIRLCLQLGVTPVFAPPRETGFQAAIENYNARWQQKVWHRFHHSNLRGLATRSRRFVIAARQRAAPRIDAAPPRRSLSRDWSFDLQAPLAGTVIYIRRTDQDGIVHLLGHQFLVRSDWTHRLVRTEVDLSQHQIRFYALRRRQPDKQSLLCSMHYRPRPRPFRD